MNKMDYFQTSLCVVCLAFIGACIPPQPPSEPTEPLSPTATIESVTQYFAAEAIPVQGIGIVAGLSGTGSSECPANIRQELEKYIWKQVPEGGSINPRTLIESLETAVVEVSGLIPALATSNEVFDVRLKPLSSTQTTSLDGGYLYTAELKELSRLTSVEQFTRFSKTLATAEGPVFSLKNEETQKSWFVLGGGRACQDSFVKLILKNPDFRTANAIRNRIGERFGPKTAITVSTAEMTVVFPDLYKEQKQRFLQIVQSLLLSNNPQSQKEYTQSLIKQLRSKTNIESTEIGLESIGRPASDELAVLLEDPDPEIQFHAARCLINIGDRRSLALIRSLIRDKNSPYRLEAIKTVGLNAKRQDALSILTFVLNDSDVKARLAAYEMLVRLNSPQITRKIIANGSFVVDSVVCSGPKMVYVYRSQSPRIVIFGSPVYCQKNIFIQSNDGAITLNAKPDDKYISVSRKHPNRPRVIGPLYSSHELSILIQTMGELPEISTSSSTRRPGLAIAYSQIAPILEKMAEEGAIFARFVEGPAPELEPLLQYLPSK